MFDRMRDAVIVPRGSGEVAITLDALESLANRRLTPADAVDLVVDEVNLFRRAANATPADDGVVTLTRNLLLERSWDVNEHAE